MKNVGVVDLVYSWDLETDGFYPVRLNQTNFLSENVDCDCISSNKGEEEFYIEKNDRSQTYSKISNIEELEKEVLRPSQTYSKIAMSECKNSVEIERNRRSKTFSKITLLSRTSYELPESMFIKNLQKRDKIKRFNTFIKCS